MYLENPYKTILIFIRDLENFNIILARMNNKHWI